MIDELLVGRVSESLLLTASPLAATVRASGWRRTKAKHRFGGQLWGRGLAGLCNLGLCLGQIKNWM